MAARNLSQGSVPKLVAVLALPVLATFLLQSAYALADLWFVGRLGGDAIAALSICLNTFFVVLALGQSVGTGGLALISQSYGRGEHALVPGVFQQVVWLALLVGVAVWLLAWIFARQFVGFFTADAKVLLLGTQFFRIYAATFLTQLLMLAASYSFRAAGDFILPTIIMGVTVLLNVALDPLLIFGVWPFPAMGVEGAALATVVAQSVGVLAYAWLVMGTRRSALLVLRRPFVWDGRTMWRIVKIGGPAGVQFLLLFAALTIGYRYLAPYGADATAALGVSFRIQQSLMLPGIAIGSAVSALSGQNYGAHQYSRVKQALWWGGVYITVIFTAEYGLILISPQFWVGLFASDPGILRVGAQALVISCLIMPFYGVDLMTTFGAQGLGRTFAPLLAVTFRLAATVVGLVVLTPLVELTPLVIFWVGSGAVGVEILAMVVVMVLLLRWVLSKPDVPLAQRLAGSTSLAGTAPVTQPAPVSE